VRRLAIFGCLLLLVTAAPGAATAKKNKRTDPVLTTLSALQVRGRQDAANATAWRRLYNQGKIAARHLRGSARTNMKGVLANLTSLAKRRLLGDRAFPAFLILQRNVEWFWQDRKGAAAYGTRTTFPGSQIIYEFYPGSGWQLQPLANFGKINGLLKLKHPKAGQIESYADEMLQTAVTRHGFLAFEYYFPWSGGPPGWVSGMATATGMQALSTLAQRDGQTRYADAAHSMLGVFESGPPWGIQLQRPEGLFFLQYSQDPSLLVGNAYAQSILGLDVYARNSGDTTAASLVRQAVDAARQILPQYDTGAWSLYYRTPRGPGHESDLSYHQLFESFLAEMCQRWQAPFCDLAANFQRYETEPVELTSLRAKVDKRKRQLRVGFTISKRSGVTLSLKRGSKTVYSWLSPLERGKHKITWALPKRGSYQIVLAAKSLNGIASQISIPLAVPR
jgi:D-glucuronyl C5-epimerase C-terminus